MQRATFHSRDFSQEQRTKDGILRASLFALGRLKKITYTYLILAAMFTFGGIVAATSAVAAMPMIPIIPALLACFAFIYGAFTNKNSAWGLFFCFAIVGLLSMMTGSHLALIAATLENGLELIVAAFAGTSLSLFGLSAYTFLSNEDFNPWKGFLSNSLLGLLGASLVASFVPSLFLHAMLSAVSIAVFSGYIVFDTARILESNRTAAPEQMALQLFLDTLNLFLNILKIFTIAFAKPKLSSLPLESHSSNTSSWKPQPNNSYTPSNVYASGNGSFSSQAQYTAVHNGSMLQGGSSFGSTPMYP